MTQTIRVTSAQRTAAQFLVERAERLGQDVDPAVQAIAQARPSERAKRRSQKVVRAR